MSLVSVAIAVMNAHVKPVSIDARFGSVILRRYGKLDSLPALRRVRARGDRQIGATRIDSLHPRHPTAGERVVQDPRIVGLEVKCIGRLYFDPKLMLLQILDDFPGRLVLNQE